VASSATARAPATSQQPPGAAIASAHALATEAGHRILAQGGNAFDAAVAVSSVLSVVEPVSSGLGGGGFFLLHDAGSGRDVMIDARETAPHSVTVANYRDSSGGLDRDKSENGPVSAGIPGLPAGLVHLAKTYGRLPLSTTLAPAIHLARNGFALYPRLVNSYAERRQVMERYAGTRRVYLADGDPPELGETLTQPDLARTLERLAAQGFDGFYRGETARKLVADVAKYGGDWNADDLSKYRIKEREPIRFRYRDWQIVTAPPPSSGGVALAEMLHILDAWNLAELGEAQRVHLTVEAMRRAYRDRSLYLGDPDFVHMPLVRLLSEDYAAGLRAGILSDRATPSAMLPGTKAPREGDNTTHFSIIDSQGNFVAATQSINLRYGSGMVAEGTGVLLNDEMDDFALLPGVANAFGVTGSENNAPASGKRMLSSMTPSFMISPNRVAVIGTPGGSRIITMVLLALLGVEQGLDPAQIVALPRYHHQYLPDTIYLEPTALTAETVNALETMGHPVTREPNVWGNMQMVDWDRRNNVLRAGSDPRNPVGKAEIVRVP
jgi:gamma-glutamyltranspeptidase/glutathione hydrolase